MSGGTAKDMDANLPATTEETHLPTTELAAPSSAPAARPRQNLVAALYPMALGVLILVFLGLAFWTLMAVTGGSGL